MSNLRIIAKYLATDSVESSKIKDGAVVKAKIAEQAVDGTKVLFNNNEMLQAKNAAGAATNLLKLNASDNLEFPVGVKPQLSSYAAPTTDVELAAKKYVDDEDAAEASARETADGSLKGAIDAEVSVRGNADTSLKNAIDAEVSLRGSEDTSLKNAIDAEVSLRGSEDTSLKNAVDAEASVRGVADTSLKGAIDGEISLRGTSDESLRQALLKEISDREAAVLAAGGDNSTALNAEISNRQTADLSLKSAIDAEVSNRIAAVTQEVSDRNSAISTAVNDLIGSAPGLLETLTGVGNAMTDGNAATGILNALASEKSGREQADNSLKGAIDAEVSLRASEDTSLKNAIDAEISLRGSEDTSLKNAIDAEISLRGSEDTSLKNAIDNEISVRGVADASLKAQIDIIDGSGGAAFVGFNPAVPSDWDSGVDTVKEALDQAGADKTVQAGQISALQSDVTALLNNTKGLIWSKNTGKTLASGDLTYIDLPHAVVQDTLVLFVGRLALHKTADYTLSTVGGVTRVTWAGSVASGQDEALVAGDKIFWTYARLVS